MPQDGGLSTSSCQSVRALDLFLLNIHENGSILHFGMTKIDLSGQWSFLPIKNKVKFLQGLMFIDSMSLSVNQSYINKLFTLGSTTKNCCALSACPDQCHWTSQTWDLTSSPSPCSRWWWELGPAPVAAPPAHAAPQRHQHPEQLPQHPRAPAPQGGGRQASGCQGTLTLYSQHTHTSLTTLTNTLFIYNTHTHTLYSNTSLTTLTHTPLAHNTHTHSQIYAREWHHQSCVSMNKEDQSSCGEIQSWTS